MRVRKHWLSAGLALTIATGSCAEVGDVVAWATTCADFDTRYVSPIVVPTPGEASALAWSSSADWVKDGEAGGASVVLTATPMMAFPDSIANWIVAGEARTLVAAQTGEGIVDFSPVQGGGYRFDYFLGEKLVSSRYLAVGTDLTETRATVAVTNLALVAGQKITPEVAVAEGATVGTLQYRWCRRSFDEVWSVDNVVATTLDYTLPEDDSEYFLSLLVTDESGVVGRSEPIWISKLPVVYIATEKAVLDKNDVGATMRMQGNAKYGKDKQLYSGALTMHVRGNTTSQCDKKPYKIKLDKKHDLLGLGNGSKNKHWLLLSNPFDISLMRCKVIYDLSEQLGLTAMHSDWVDVILNGEFVGNYLLCEHIRVGKDRVDIFDWEGEADDVAEKIATAESFDESESKALETHLEQNLQWITSGSFDYRGTTYTLGDYGIDVSKYDTTGGYLFELGGSQTWRMGASKDGEVVLDMPIEAKSPEYLRTNAEMFGYVQEKWSNYWAAVVSPDGYYRGRHYSELGDIDSMVGYWLAQVIPAQDDSLYSRYAYIPQRKGITWGPAWDFDASAGGRSIDWVISPTAGVTGGRGGRLTGWILGILRRDKREFYCDWNNDPHFVKLLVEKFAEVRPYLDELLKDGGKFDEMYDYIKESGIANAKRWAGRLNGVYEVTEGTRFDDYPGVAGPNGYGDAHWFKYVLKSRIEWIDERFSSVRSAVGELSAAGGANPFVDEADKFKLTVTTKNFELPDSVEGESPDLVIPAGTLTATLAVLADDAETVDVYVNGLSNGTAKVVAGAADIMVPAEALKAGERSTMTYVAKDKAGNALAKSYALLTTVRSEDYPKFPGEVAAEATLAADFDTRTGERKLATMQEILPFAYGKETATITVTAQGGGAVALPTTAGEEGTTFWTPSAKDAFRAELVDATGNVLTADFDLRGCPETPLGAAVVTLSAKEVVYAGEESKPAVTVVLNGETLVEGRDYTVCGDGVLAVGPATLVVAGAGDYFGRFEFPYVIQPVPATLAADFDTRTGERTLATMQEILPFAYGKETATITVTAQGGGAVALPTTAGEEGTTFWTPSAKDAFRAELADAAGNVLTADFDLRGCPETPLGAAVVTLSAKEVVYAGEESKPAVTVVLNGETLVEGRDYTVCGDGVLAVGPATLVVAGAGDYFGRFEFPYVIQPVPATLAADFDTRTGAVRELDSVDEILPFAYNNASDWRAGGDPNGQPATVKIVRMDAEEGEVVLVEQAGEGVVVWPSAKPGRYRATLRAAEGITSVEIWVTAATEPTVPEGEGTIEKVADGVWTVTPVEGETEITVLNLPEGATLVLPPPVAKVAGVRGDTKIVIKSGDYLITDAFTVLGGVITLNEAGAVKIGDETIPVKPVLSEATDEVKPLVVGDEVSIGVKSIPGLVYELLRGENPTGFGAIGDGVKEAATGPRVRLTDPVPPKDKAFYRIQVNH